MKIDFKNPLFQWFVLLLLAFVWGSSFILMKRGLEVFDSKQVAAYRVFIAFIGFLPVIVLNLKKLQQKFIVPLVLSGLLGSAIPAFLFTTAQKHINSSFAGMLNSFTPLFTLLLGVLFFKMKVLGTNIIGVFLGMLGICGLIMSYYGFSLTGEIVYALLVVIATFCYAINVNLIKAYLADIGSLLVASFAFLFIGPIAGFYLFSTDFVSRVVEHPQGTQSLVYISILGLMGTAFASIVFNLLIKQVSALFASSVTYLIPIFAIFWGIADGEAITLQHVFWMLVVLVGVYLVTVKKDIFFLRKASI